MKTTRWAFVSFLVSAAIVCVSGCSPEADSKKKADQQSQADRPPKQRRKVDVTPNPNEKIVETKSGLKYVEIKEGTGEPAKAGDGVAVHYTGWLDDGTVFDSSVDRGQTLKFILGARKVIKGWDEGVAGMKPGGKRKLIIPPELAYGPRQVGIIKPNSQLTFEVELVEIQ
jgi:FKBP-type peptidyl-prolyl cis-trans isomerase